MQPDADSTPTRRHRTHPAALSGTLYVLFFLISLVLGGATSPKGAPFATPYSADNVARAALRTDPEALHRSLQLTGLFQLLSALALLAFVPALADYAQQHAGSTRAGLVRAAATASAVLLLLSASTSWVLSMVNATADLPTARALQDLVFITGAAPAIGTLGLAVGAVSATALRARERTLPAWLGWSGLVIAAASLLSVLSLVAEPATLAIPFGRYVGFVWFLAVSLFLWKRGGPLPGAETPDSGLASTEPAADRLTPANRRA